MFIILIGAGNLGVELIEKLISLKNDLIIIEKEKNLCDYIFAEYGIETICADATKLSVLKSAGINRADMLISTIRKDDLNLAISVLAKSSGVKDIIVFMRDKNYADAYKISGATHVLNIVNALVDEIMYYIEKPKIKRITSLRNGTVEIFIIDIPSNAKIIGKTVSEIASNKHMPIDSIIAGIYCIDDNDFQIPRGNTRIKPNSSLFVITKPELVEKTAKFLMS